MSKILSVFDGSKVLKNEGTVNVGGGSSSNPLIISKIAGENITSFKAVIITNNQAFIYNPDDVTKYNRLVGIANSGAVIGNSIEILTFGILTVSYAVTVGSTYFANNTGALTTTPNSTGVLQEIGTGISSNSIFIDIKQPLILS